MVPQTELVLVRAKKGVSITLYDPLTQKEEDEQTVYALFFLISPESNPSQHLRILAQIAGRVDEESFMPEWLEAGNYQQLKEAILNDERFQALKISSNSPTSLLVNHALKDITIPKGCLVTMLQRGPQTIVPNGNSILNEGDRITVIGDEKGLMELRKLYR